MMKSMVNTLVLVSWRKSMVVRWQVVYNVVGDILITMTLMRSEVSFIITSFDVLYSSGDMPERGYNLNREEVIQNLGPIVTLKTCQVTVTSSGKSPNYPTSCQYSYHHANQHQGLSTRAGT